MNVPDNLITAANNKSKEDFGGTTTTTTTITRAGCTVDGWPFLTADLF